MTCHGGSKILVSEETLQHPGPLPSQTFMSGPMPHLGARVL